MYISRPELGTKRACVSCAARFYDLSRAPPTCPKCGAEQPPDVPRPRHPGRGNATGGGRRAPWQVAPAPAAEADEAAPEAEEVDDEADAAVIDDDDAEDDVAEIDAEIPLNPSVSE